ncbi:hypothetical protein [Robinsoniella peoriensis]|uniref:hypothetical protein n=1 Tax=Robinsoniella peoriensis TaxID=180332 RepID=UPI003629AEF2
MLASAMPLEAGSAVTTALGTWVTGMVSDVSGAVTTNLPVILGVVTFGIVIGFVVRFAKRFAK